MILTTKQLLNPQNTKKTHTKMGVGGGGKMEKKGVRGKGQKWAIIITKNRGQ